MNELFLILIPILIAVESGGDANAVGDRGAAVGCLQIHEIYVDDANRLTGKNTYTYEDRYNRKKSIEMVKIVLAHYAPVQIKSLHRLDQIVVLARIHNGGPLGYLKTSTMGYADKIVKEYKKQKN